MLWFFTPIPQIGTMSKTIINNLKNEHNNNNILWTKYQHKADIVWSSFKRKSDKEIHTQTIRWELLLISGYIQSYYGEMHHVLSQYKWEE